MRLGKYFRLLLAALALLLLAGGAAGESELDSLIRKLDHGNDFRMRVQAALQLGKSGDTRATKPLGKALDDQNASVRAAAAAALKTLGDPDALPALREARLDRSSAVRQQIQSAIASIEEQVRDVKVLVQLGSMKNRTAKPSSQVTDSLKDASQRSLRRIRTVAVVGASEDVMKIAKRRKLPAVLMTGSISKLEAEQDGSSLLYTAKVEYVLHRMPEHAIAGKVSGSASARASASEISDVRRHAELRDDVLEAAVDSALRRSPPAILAAAAL